MRTRIITALVGITLMIPVFWYSDTYLLPTVMALLCVVGNFELMRCIGVHKKYALAVPQYVIAAAMPFLMRLGGTSTDYFEAAVFIHVALMCYMLALAVFSHGKMRVEQAAMTFAICLYINMGFGSVVLLRDFEDKGVYIFLLVFIGAWISDIFAYFCGMAFGKHKLIPDVSPKKTVEGSVGAVVFTALAFVLYGVIISHSFDVRLNAAALGVFGAIMSVVSQIGDLSASLIKREYGIKDYGACFPGHGGVIDRFDSALAVSSVLMALVYSLEIV